MTKGFFFYHTFKVKSTELEALLQLKICTVRTNVDYHSDIMKSYTLRFVNHPPGHKVTRPQQKADTNRMSKGSYKGWYRLAHWSIPTLAAVQELIVLSNVEYQPDIMKSYTLRFVNHPPGHKVTRPQQKADTNRIQKGSYKG